MDKLKLIKEQYTAENRDKLLAYLLKNCDINRMHTGISAVAISEELGIYPEFIGGFLEEFNALGLIDYKGFSFAQQFNIIVFNSASAFYNRSGFVFQEQLFVKNLQLLEVQIKELENKIPIDTFQSVTGIVSNVLQIASGLFLPKL